MIIDAHCHAGQGDGLTGPWDTRARLGDYLRRAAIAGIGQTILLPASNSDYQAANRSLARIVHAGAGRFIGFAMVHPDRDGGRVGQLIDTAVNAYGFRASRCTGTTRGSAGKFARRLRRTGYRFSTT
jgi:uncharacterized protein